jgi:integrase
MQCTPASFRIIPPTAPEVLTSDNIPPAVKKTRFKPLVKKLPDVMAATRETSVYVFTALAAATGARRGELLALRWNDITDGLIDIHGSVEETKAGGVKIDRTKTEGSVRRVSIDAATAAMLHKEHVRLAELALALGQRLCDDALVFPRHPARVKRDTSWQHSPRRPSTVTALFGRAMKDAGMTGFRVHDLRHAHATYLLSAEPPIPITAISERLGHANVSTTLNIYCHGTDEDDKKAADTFAPMMAKLLGNE